MATGLSMAQVGHAPHIKAWIPPLGTNAWVGAAVARLQVGLEKTQRRGKPGAGEEGGR